MPRVKSLQRRIAKNISLPEDIVVRMELELYSDVEERVPVGAQARLIEQLLREHFGKLDYKRKLQAQGKGAEDGNEQQ